jgi:hypothetical protein
MKDNESADGQKEVYAWVRRGMVTAKYVYNEGRLGFIVAAVVVTILNPREIVDLLSFPPDDKIFARFLVFGVAAAVWDTTRVWFNNSKKREVPPLGTVNDKDPNQKVCEAANTFHGKMRVKAQKRLILALVLFTIYFSLSGTFIYKSAALGDMNLPKEESKSSSYITFCRPFWVPADFKKMIGIQSNLNDYKAGFRHLVDNDPYWLMDFLDRYSWRVMLTKVLLLFCVLFGTAALIFGTTIISLLDDGVE